LNNAESCPDIFTGDGVYAQEFKPEGDNVITRAQGKISTSNILKVVNSGIDGRLH
jgi:adenine-specific DNA methylase